MPRPDHDARPERLRIGQHGDRSGRSRRVRPRRRQLRDRHAERSGSSAQKNAVAEWIKAYQTACAGSTINYEGSGSGAGINAFIAGTADFAGSDSALKEDQQPKADQRCAGNPAIHLPAVIGPIAVVFNVDGVEKLNLTPATLAKIFAGKVTKWNAPEIAADNSGVTLPDVTINPVHRSDESGTTENFTKYLAKVAEADWTYEAAKSWPSDIKGGTGQKARTASPPPSPARPVPSATSRCPSRRTPTSPPPPSRTVRVSSPS